MECLKVSVGRPGLLLTVFPLWFLFCLVWCLGLGPVAPIFVYPTLTVLGTGKIYIDMTPYHRNRRQLGTVDPRPVPHVQLLVCRFIPWIRVCVRVRALDEPCFSDVPNGSCFPMYLWRLGLRAEISRRWGPLRYFLTPSKVTPLDQKSETFHLDCEYTHHPISLFNHFRRSDPVGTRPLSRINPKGQ